MNSRRIIMVALVIGALVIRIPHAVQGQEEPSGRLDLPAMTLTSTDLEEFGLAGFGRFGNGEFRTFDDYVARRAEFLNVPEAEFRSSLEDAGWQRGYVSNLGLSAEPGNRESPSIQIGFSVIYEYADAEGAATAYDLNRNYEGVTVGKVEISEPSQSYGDASYATRLVATTPTDGEPVDQIDLVLRRGNIVASAGLIALWRGDDLVTTAALPDNANSVVEKMAERLLERIDTVLAGDAPGLSNRTLRLGGDDIPIAFATEGYRRLDGDDPAYYNGFEDDFPGPDGRFDAVTSAYELNQGLQMEGDPYYVVRLLVFPDANGAADYVADVRAAGLSPAGTPAEELAGATQHGDSSWTVAYSAEPEPGVRVEGIAVFAHLGETALMLLWEGASAPAPELVRELATAQISCLTADTCAAVRGVIGNIERNGSSVARLQSSGVWRGAIRRRASDLTNTLLLVGLSSDGPTEKAKLDLSLIGTVV